MFLKKIQFKNEKSKLINRTKNKINFLYIAPQTTDN
jgi:hypothetical protein